MSRSVNRSARSSAPSRSVAKRWSSSSIMSSRPVIRSRTPAAYSASALRSRSAASSAALSRPSRSTSSSSKGTSETVHASPMRRASAGSAPAARNRSGEVYSSDNSVSGVSIGHSASRAAANPS
ncbi:Uncharacterised protein [Mycobacteroides abscessus subsp. abscessus]|nr:Uncharacterised protein [Mycobacteroides abscessus subsp. abscessus]